MLDKMNIPQEQQDRMAEEQEEYLFAMSRANPNNEYI